MEHISLQYASNLPYLLDRVGVRGSSDVETQVVLVRGADDLLARALHCVLQAGVHNILKLA